MVRKLIYLFLIAWLVSPQGAAFAQEQYSLKEMTPEVQQALDGRKDRYERLSEYKQQGLIGETNRGYVKLLKEDEAAAELVEQENGDRKTIYKTVAQQNGIEDALPTIEKVFAQVQREKASPGDMIQLESGEWVTK